MPAPLDRSAIADDAPLRLDAAAALAFPDGTMSAAGLRREAAKGRLAIMRIAGRDYTTMAAIREMIERCRVEPRARDYGSAPSADGPTAASTTTRRGSSSTTAGNTPLASALMIVDRLSGRSPSTSPPDTSRPGGSVTSLPSRSRT